jgi:hypothetical protein
MRQALFMMGVVCLAACATASVRAEPSPAEVDRRVQQAIQEVREAQAEADRWAEKREAMRAEIRELKARKAWLDFQARKHEAYAATQKRRVAELERRKQEAQRIRVELEPFLEEVLARLESFVDADLPFLKQERRRRLGFLRRSLDDPRLGLGEKLRRVLEALQVEAGYGRDTEVVQRTLQLDGEPVRVSVFRLGRLGLYYVGPDGSRAGMYDPSADAWRPLPERFAKPLSSAMDMARRRRAADFLDLPIPGGRP